MYYLKNKCFYTKYQSFYIVVYSLFLFFSLDSMRFSIFCSRYKKTQTISSSMKLYSMRELSSVAISKPIAKDLIINPQKNVKSYPPLRISQKIFFVEKYLSEIKSSITKVVAYSLSYKNLSICTKTDIII